MPTTVHVLKSWPDYFRDVFEGRKTFELRLNDRKYAVGDILHLREFDDRKGTFTGREIKKRVTHLIDGIGPGAIPPMHGLQRGYCIMSIAPLDEEAAK